MALVRCNSCGIKPPGRGGHKRAYVRSVQPLGHPKSTLICGSPSCSETGLFWLEKGEADAYDKGERIFGLATNTTKVRAQ
jgi:hypothetical protein